MSPRSPHRHLAITACLACLMFLAGPGRLAAQAPFLVKDINPGAASDPKELVTIGGTVYFVADDGSSGLEVWKSDGTLDGTMLVADVCAGTCSSYPARLTAVGQTLFFVADDAEHGAELWKSDAAGTELVKDILPGAQVPAIAELQAFNGELFFRANDGTNGNELWKSDGTEEGTVMVSDIDPGSSSSYPGELTVVGTTLFFAATGNLGRELWKSDGTTPGTELARDINGGAGSSTPSGLTAVGNMLYLTAWGGDGRELWNSDGTTTRLVKDIYPGFDGSYPSGLVDAGAGVVYFMADDGQIGSELWKSDGTPEGTVLVKDILSGAESSGGADLVVAEGVLFLTADDGLIGKELWKSDGTEDGTQLVLDINSGANGSSPGEIEAVGGAVYFSADDGIAGEELWLSDGSGEGTNMVGDLVLGPSGSNPADPATAPTLLFFAADEATAGRELWALLVGGPVLGLSNQFAEPSAVVGTGGHSFTLTVSNSGSGTSEDVHVTALVDSRLTVNQVTPAGECFDSNGQSISCTFPTLLPGESELITVAYEVYATVEPAADVPNLAAADAQNAELVQAIDHVDLLAPCQGMPVDNYLSNETVSTQGYVAEACNLLSATGFVVAATGEATLRAGTAVVLNDGLVVAAGGSLIVFDDPLQATE